MEEKKERNELGYDDSIDGDFLKEIEDKISFLQEAPDLLRFMSAEGRRTEQPGELVRKFSDWNGLPQTEMEFNMNDM